jgi:hypothetical protein
MALPTLKICPPLGSPRHLHPPIPGEIADDGLPVALALSPSELDLATRYENGDISGGYAQSQAAYFRMGPSIQSHELRRAMFATLCQELSLTRLGFPASFQSLMMSDRNIARLRHNNIRFDLTALIAITEHPDCRLVPMCIDAQACGFWYLFIGPGEAESAHVVAFSHAEFSGDLSQLYQCAPNFPQWLVHYVLDCIQCDRKYIEFAHLAP